MDFMIYIIIKMFSSNAVQTIDINTDHTVQNYIQGKKYCATNAWV